MQSQRLTQVEVTIPEPEAVYLDPADSLLVVVGMQNGILKEEGRLAARSAGAIAAVATLLEKFRAANGKVVFLQSVRKADALEITEFGHQADALEGTWEANIVDELVPVEGETVIPMWSLSPFVDMTFESFLLENGLLPCRSQLVVVGAGANESFDATGTGLRVRAFLVYVPLDGVVGATPQDEAVAFRHVVGSLPRGRQYNVLATSSELVVLDPEQSKKDPLVSSLVSDDRVYSDPLYKAITTLSVHD